MKSYNLFLLLAIIIFACSFFLKDKTFELLLSGRYSPLSTNYVLRIIATLFLVFWVLYKLTHRRLFSPVLFWLHFLLSVSFAGYLIFAPFTISRAVSVDDLFKRFEEIKSIRQTTQGFFYVALAGQAFFLINIIGSLVKPKASV